MTRWHLSFRPRFPTATRTNLFQGSLRVPVLLWLTALFALGRHDGIASGRGHSFLAACSVFLLIATPLIGRTVIPSEVRRAAGAPSAGRERRHSLFRSAAVARFADRSPLTSRRMRDDWRWTPDFYPRSFEETADVRRRRHAGHRPINLP